MAGGLEDLTSMITKVAQSAMKYCVPRLGMIKDINDLQQKGRVLVLVPSLGWLTNDQGAWCYPKDKRGIITPKVDDYVIVEFVNGNRNLPVYSGIATQMKDMIPKNYDGMPTTDVIYEDDDGDISIVADRMLKSLVIRCAGILGIKLETGDASGWQPNTLAVDPYSGVPHGGVGAGIIKLTGG